MAPFFRKNKNAGLIQEPGKNRLTLAEIAFTGGSQQIRDVSTSLWFPAGQPITPVSPRGTPPRRYPYQPLTNINFTGRSGGVNFATLRRFSNYTICRAIIESVLDRLCSEKWDFRIIAQDDETEKDYKKRNATDPRVKALKKFFRKPDGWQNFRTWSRGLYDDMLVIDAASIWLQRDTNGKIASLVQIDGSQVFPLVDETGQQPDAGVLVQTEKKKASKDYLNKVKAKGGKISTSDGNISVQGGSPAFQLTPYGFPAQEMTAKELVYAVRNRKTFTKYGFSTVEQSLAMIALGLARQDFQAAYYTSGNVPEFIAFLPPDVPVNKAEELNGYLDSILTGQLGNRRKGFFLPSYGSEKSPNIVFPKANDEVLKDTFDEWIARVLCFFFGMSPTAFIKQVNRAVADNMSQESEEQGLQPYLDWMGDTLNEIVQNQFGFDDIEAVTGSRKEQDAEKQANIDKIHISTAIKTINEVREQNGDDPYENCPEADLPLIITATGAVPLGVDSQIEQTQSKIQAGVIPDPNAPPEPSGGKGKPGGKTPPKKKAYGLTSKADTHDSRHNWPALSPGINGLSTKSHAARVRTEVAVQKCFGAAKRAVVGHLGRLHSKSLSFEKARKFDSVQFNLPDDDAKKVLSIPVDAEDFAEKGREQQPHITVLFGFDDIPVEQIKAAIEGMDNVDVVLGDFIAFPAGPDGEPLVIKVESDSIHQLHDALTTIPNHETHPVYKPHVTVGYVKEGAGAKYVAAGNPLKGHKIKLSDLVLSRKDKTVIPLGKVRKDDDDDQKQLEDQLYAQVQPSFQRLPFEIRQAFEDSALSGVTQGVLQLGMDDADLISSINQQASDWARERAAELVGMAYDDEGNLIENPDAKWTITETTREDLRDIIADAFEGNTNWEDIVTNIKAALETSRVFSDARAQMIARTEIGRSQMGSGLDVWRRSGLVTKLLWEVEGENPCVFCLLNDGEEVEFGKPFPSGAYSTLDSHPNCQCLVRAVGILGGSEQEDHAQ